MATTKTVNMVQVYLDLVQASTPEDFARVSAECHKVVKLAGIIRQTHDEKWDVYAVTGNLTDATRIRKPRETSDENGKVKEDPFLAALNG